MSTPGPSVCRGSGSTTRAIPFISVRPAPTSWAAIWLRSCSRPASFHRPELPGRPEPDRRRLVRILLLAEGNAESWESWSGISKSIVDQLRAGGHTVHVGDVDLSGWDRWLAAAATFSPNRHRWGSRFHLDAVPFRLRSRRAKRHIASHRSRIDAIV